MAIQAERDGFDAIVIYCFSDVGLEACRENVRIPVIAPGETALAVAQTLCNRFVVVTGAGWSIPRTYRRMMRNGIAREFGMRYSSDLYDDDRPYFMKVNDNGDKILQIPMQWANFDLPYFAFNYRPAFPFGQGRVANYSNVLSNWKDEFTGHYNHNLCYNLQLDPQSTGSPGRFAMLKEFLQYICEHEGVWFATGSELVEYCAKNEAFFRGLRE